MSYLQNLFLNVKWQSLRFIQDMLAAGSKVHWHTPYCSTCSTADLECANRISDQLAVPIGPITSKLFQDPSVPADDWGSSGTTHCPSMRHSRILSLDVVCWLFRIVWLRIEKKLSTCTLCQYSFKLMPTRLAKSFNDMKRNNKFV